jgi:hypothetical protein
MPFLILYGGELAFAFLGARVAVWMWRSRERVRQMWRERHGSAPCGPSFTPDPTRVQLPEPIALAAPPPLRREDELAPLRRAA